ncbi:alpha/beta hydrolase [Gordonia sp. NPDC003424]
MSVPPESSEPTAISEGWTVADPGVLTESGDASSRRAPRGRRRRLTGVAIVAVLSLVLFGISALLSGSNKASALAGHPEVLRPGCTWDKSGNYVQNCKVWSKSMNKYVIVQIRASNGSDKGVYLLDGMRASEDRSAWTTDVQAAKVYDGKTDTTLVMPVGGASSFYTDWNAGAGANGTVIKQETFLTSELPDYLASNFGVSRNNNAIVGLSMSGGPAVTLAERHPDQFKVVQAMSGYYQTANPIGAAGVFASQTMVSNYTNGILNMWGAPGSQQWKDNDPSRNVSKLKENGQVLIISSGNGFLTPSEMAKLKPEDQISAIALEILSAVSTVLMQLQAGQSGASVISLPNYGGHTWENWGRGLADGKDHVLDALKSNPPVTAKTQVVTASGSKDPEGSTKATQAAVLAAKASPVMSQDPSEDARDPSESAPSSSEESTASSTEVPDPSDPVEFPGDEYGQRNDPRVAAGAPVPTPPSFAAPPAEVSTEPSSAPELPSTTTPDPTTTPEVDTAENPQPGHHGDDYQDPSDPDEYPTTTTTPAPGS